MGAVMQDTEVIATVRKPDGHPNAEIDGVVIRQQASGGGWFILSKSEAIDWARKQLLWCRDPGDGRGVRVEPVDADGDGYYDYVRTVPDSTRRNNLLAHLIWDRVQKRWVDPATGMIAGPPA